MTGVNTASSREEKVVLPLELRTALLCWYPFRYGKRALYLGNDKEAHVPVLRRWFEAVDESFNDACAYDFIMVHDWRGAENELEELLGKCSQLLSGNGVLLLGFRNRFGLKYLCGGLDDVVSHPFSSVGISKDADCDLFSRGEMEYLLDCSSFEHVRFYSILPDAGFAQAVCSDDYKLKAGVHDRVLPYDPYDSPLVVPESDFYKGAAREDLLTRFANYYLVECRLHQEAPLEEKVLFAALSADRGQRNSYATVLYANKTALKRPLHEQGRLQLEKLYQNGEALRSRGIRVVNQELTVEGITMPLVKDEPLLTYLDRQLLKGKEAFLDVFSQMQRDYLASSPLTAIDESAAVREWGIGANELGPVLKRGFIDMIPYNAFWSNEGITYYDQEFSVDYCPVGYIMFRALRYTYVHLPHAEQTVSLRDAQNAFGLTELWDVFMERENKFVGNNRNWQRYQQVYNWANIDRDACRERRERMISQLELPSSTGGSCRNNSLKPYGVGLLMGVFDLFHVGHLRLIRRAKAECDYLRVGVLSDDLVLEFKHKKPVIPIEERMEVLGAIAEVDEVVEIKDNPSRLQEWHKRPFDCFFSGNDYEGNPYWEWEREELRKLGSDIRFFPYTEQQSSTRIRKHLG